MIHQFLDLAEKEQKAKRRYQKIDSETQETEEVEDHRNKDEYMHDEFSDEDKEEI